MNTEKTACPYCGGTDFVTGKQQGHGAVMPVRGMFLFHGQTLYHDICGKCGTVVRSYIKEPEKFVGKKD